jgi:hypothetical protein
MPKTLTDDQAFSLPLEQAFALYREVYGVEHSAEQQFTQKPHHARPATGMVGALGPALESVATDRGEHVVENTVSRYGLCRLRIVKVGSAFSPRLYVDQIFARGDVATISSWVWSDASSGQVMHVRLIVWKWR